MAIPNDIKANEGAKVKAFLVRVSPELHARLKAICDSKGIPVERFVRRLIETRLERAA